MKDDFNSPEQKRDFAFFKVSSDGQSARAISHVLDSRERITSLRKKIREAWPGMAFFPTFIDDKSCIMIFEKDRLPKGWIREDWGWVPPQGCEERKEIQALCKLAQDILKTSTLEGYFGIDAFENPRWGWTDKFVRGGENAYRMAPGQMDLPMSKRAPGEMYEIDDDRQRVDNKMEFVRLLDDWYIRVPCDTKGKPHFTPPDCAEVSYHQIWTIDREHAIKRGLREAQDRMISNSLSKQKP